MQIEEKYSKAQCFKCKHLVFNPCEFWCPAFEFEKGIPKNILLNKFIHDKKHPKQINAILFEEGERQD